MLIGIDLGGTNIAAGIVDKNNKIVCSDSCPTLSERPYTEIVKDMAQLCKKLIAEAGLNEADIEGIGIGSPGTVDNKNGVIIYANNLGWDNVPLAEELRKYIDVPVNIENDANAAAYGEFMECGGDVDSFVAITLGTGVGGGVIIDKKIYRGFNGAGGELGHTVLIHGGEPCTCGNDGCWESYASVTALIRQTKEAIKNHPESMMAKDEKVSGRTAFNAAKAGDSAGQTVVDNYIEYVASGITNIINIFQPNILVIGGGISKEGDYLLNPIKEYAKLHTYCKAVEQTEIKIASLMNDAGIIGAALACGQ